MWDFSAYVMYSLKIPIEYEICYGEETIAMNYWMFNIPLNFVVKWLYSVIQILQYSNVEYLFLSFI